MDTTVKDSPKCICSLYLLFSVHFFVPVKHGNT